MWLCSYIRPVQLRGHSECKPYMSAEACFKHPILHNYDGPNEANRMLVDITINTKFSKSK